MLHDAAGHRAVLIERPLILQPTSLWLQEAAASEPAPIKTLPPRFDATRDVVEQFEATSSDGTKVPYFVVHPRGMVLDGSNP